MVINIHAKFQQNRSRNEAKLWEGYLMSSLFSPKLSNLFNRILTPGALGLLRKSYTKCHLRNHKMTTIIAGLYEVRIRKSPSKECRHVESIVGVTQRRCSIKIAFSAIRQRVRQLEQVPKTQNRKNCQHLNMEEENTSKKWQEIKMTLNIVICFQMFC